METAAMVRLMTADEARQCVAQIRRGMADVRYLLLELDEREGWRALGYTNFLDCAMTEFGYQKTHIYQLRNAAEVERNLSAIAETVPILPATESQARPLTKLEPDVQREVWKQAVDTAPEGKVTAKHIERTVTEWKYNQGIQYGEAASTYVPPEPEPKEDEETITIRAFELGVFMALCKDYTAAQVAAEFKLSPSGAYRLLTRASGSKRVPLCVGDDGVWSIDPVWLVEMASRLLAMIKASRPY